MKIIYVQQHFATSRGEAGVRGYNLVKTLANRGHEVTVVCGHNWRDSSLRTDGRRIAEFDLDGFRVVQLRVFYSNHQSFLKRLCSFFLFAVLACREVARRNADLVFASSTPLTVSIPALFGRLFKGIPYVFEVRDLWPDLPIEMGIVRNRFVKRALYFWERCAYRFAWRLVALAPGIKQEILRKAEVDPSYITMVPNGSDCERLKPLERLPRKHLQIADDVFAIGYCGTHGTANGLDAVLAAAAVLKQRGNSSVAFVLIGDGREKERLVRRATDEGLDNVHFVGLFNKSSYNEVLGELDAGMQILLNVPAFYYGTSPNKFFDYLAAGKPVLVNYPGWMSDLVSEHDCGVAVPPNDPTAFADAIESLNKDSSLLDQKRKNARNLAESQFSQQKILITLAEWIEAEWIWAVGNSQWSITSDRPAATTRLEDRAVGGELPSALGSLPAVSDVASIAGSAAYSDLSTASVAPTAELASTDRGLPAGDPRLPAALVTYGWCRVSYVIVNSLARRGVRVHVGDASSLAMCRYSRYHASFSRYRSPYRDPEGFVEDIASAVAQTGAAVLIPGHEDILAIAKYRDRLPDTLLTPVGEADAIAQTINKWHTAKLARAAGVPVPETFKPESRDELVAYARQLRYPAVIKTQLGNSGKGVFVVHNAEECVGHFDRLVETYKLSVDSWPIVQTFAPGSGYGVCVLYNRGEFRASFCERYVRCKDGQFGTSVFRESVRAPELEAHARALMGSLKWHGVAHLDFHYDEATGKAALIEINPRFWGALDLAVRAGVDFPWLLYRMAVDGDVEPINSYRLGVKSRWIVGEMLHVFNFVRRGRVGRAAKAMSDIIGTRSDGYDDFRVADPIPLLFEMLYYGSGFLSTGSTNPIEDGMIR